MNPSLSAKISHFFLSARKGQNGPYENRTKTVASLNRPSRDRIRLATLS